MEVPKDDIQQLLDTKQKELEALQQKFDEFKEEAVEYEKELEADNEYKEKELQALKKKLEALAVKSDDYKKEVAQLEKLYEKEKENAEKAKTELETLKTNLVRVEQENELLENQIRNLNFEKKEVKEKLDKIEEMNIVERESLSEKLNRDQEELERLRKELEEHKEEVAVLNKRNTEESESEQLKTLMEEEKMKAEKAEHQISKVLEEIEDLKKQLVDKDSKSKEMQKIIKELNEELEQKEYEAVNGIDEVDVVKGELEQVKKQLEETRKAKDEEIERLNEENEARIEQIKEELIEQLNEENELKIEQAKEELMERLNEESELRIEHAKKEQESEMIGLQLEIENLKEDQLSLNEEIENLKQKIEAKEKRIAQLEEEITKLSQNKKTEDVEKTIVLKEEMNKLKEENVNLKKENRKLKNEIRDKDNGIDQLEEEIQQMKKLIKEERFKLDAIERDIEVSRVEKTELEISGDRLLSPNRGSIIKSIGTFRQPSPPKITPNPKIEARKQSIEHVLHPRLDKRYASNQSAQPVSNKDVSSMYDSRTQEVPNKGVLKHLYTKITKLGAPSYIGLDFEKKEMSITKVSSNVKVTGKNSVACGFNSMMNKVSDLNMKHIVDASQGDNLESQLLGRNLFYMIYGAKKTDKKLIKYRILQCLTDTFKAISKKKEFVGKTCKLVLRIQDPALNKKFEVLKNFNFLQQLKCYREFELGNERGEKDLDDFINIMKQTDVTKPKSPLISSNPKGRIIPKQIFIEFSIEKSGNKQTFGSPNKADSDQDELDYSKLTEQDEDLQQDVNLDFVSRTKIMLVCTNNIKEDTYFSGLSSVDSLIDLIMTDDKVAVAKKDKQTARKSASSDNVIKHFLLTTAPTLQNYKSTFNTLALATSIEQVTKDKSSGRGSYDPKTNNMHAKSDIQLRRSSSKEVESIRRGISPNRLVRKVPSEASNRQELDSSSPTNDMLDVNNKEDEMSRLNDYSRKQEFLKDNVKSLLGLLNQVMTTSQQQEQFQKIKSQLEIDDLPVVEKSPKKIKGGLMRSSRPTSVEKMHKIVKKPVAHGN